MRVFVTDDGRILDAVINEHLSDSAAHVLGGKKKLRRDGSSEKASPLAFKLPAAASEKPGRFDRIGAWIARGEQRDGWRGIRFEQQEQSKQKSARVSDQQRPLARAKTRRCRLSPRGRASV